MSDKELTLEQMQEQFLNQKKQLEELNAKMSEKDEKLSEAIKSNEELKKVNNKLFLSVTETKSEEVGEDLDIDNEEKLDKLFEEINKARIEKRLNQK